MLEKVEYKDGIFKLISAPIVMGEHKHRSAEQQPIDPPLFSCNVLQQQQQGIVYKLLPFTPLPLEFHHSTALP